MYIIKVADAEEREKIYRLRYLVYAKELGQHKENENQRLIDDIDSFNTYIIVKINQEIAGFVSITSPGGKYGLDKYINREKYPYIYDNMFEGRLFTVLKQFRGGYTAILLFFAVLRFAEINGGEIIMTIGRTDLVEFYEKTGLIDLGELIKSGQVEFKLMFGKINYLRTKCGYLEKILERVLPRVDNQLPFPMIRETECYHGGSFFNAIGVDFKTLAKSKEIINADVLDAWFDPSPKVIEALNEYLPWIIKTSPPVQSEGLVEKIAEVRGVGSQNVLAGAGSSDLIYLALPQILNKKSKVLLLNPTYGEYRYIISNVIKCEVEFFDLNRKDNYLPDVDLLIDKLNKEKFDLFVLVNPNSPTGQYLPKEDVIKIIQNIPFETTVWVDECYIEYTGNNNSLEQFSTTISNLIICKSMSKVYALSGIRCAYLISNLEIIYKFKKFSPPWAVSLVSQIAGVNALSDSLYYEKCYQKTLINKELLVANIRKNLEIDVFSGVANSILCELPANIEIDLLIRECQKRNLFLRNVENMGVDFGGNIVRIAVKDEVTNEKISEILIEVFKNTL